MIFIGTLFCNLLEDAIRLHLQPSKFLASDHRVLLAFGNLTPVECLQRLQALAESLEELHDEEKTAQESRTLCAADNRKSQLRCMPQSPSAVVVDAVPSPKVRPHGMSTCQKGSP
jgi:hypothetical protein